MVFSPHDSSIPPSRLEDKRKGKRSRPLEEMPSTRSPTDSHPHGKAKRSKALATATDTAGPSPTNPVTADPTRHATEPGPRPAGRAGASRPVSRTSLVAHTPASSTVTSCLPNDPCLPAYTRIVHSTHTVEEIGSFGFYDEFTGRGFRTGLGYLVKWKDYPVEVCDILYNHHAVMRLDPSYLANYALWRNGESHFARLFTRSSTLDRLAAINKYFRAAHSEYLEAFAHHTNGRTEDMVLRSSSDPIPPPGRRPVTISHIPWDEKAWSPPGESHSTRPSPPTHPPPSVHNSPPRQN